MESDKGCYLDEWNRKIAFDKRPMWELSIRGEEQRKRRNSKCKGPAAGKSFVRHERGGKSGSFFWQEIQILSGIFDIEIANTMDGPQPWLRIEITLETFVKAFNLNPAPRNSDLIVLGFILSTCIF